MGAPPSSGAVNETVRLVSVATMRSPEGAAGAVARVRGIPDAVAGDSTEFPTVLLAWTVKV
jgi:hypothetical protein